MCLKFLQNVGKKPMNTLFLLQACLITNIGYEIEYVSVLKLKNLINDGRILTNGRWLILINVTCNKGNLRRSLTFCDRGVCVCVQNVEQKCDFIYGRSHRHVKLCSLFLCYKCQFFNTVTQLYIFLTCICDP